MSLKKNIAANYVSQIYVTLIGIVFVPQYIKYMGAEAYGLVGFFAMLQAWFNLLDLGLSPTISRESARYHGSAMSAIEYRRVFRALSVIFASIALMGGLVLLMLSDVIATSWLHRQSLPQNEVVLAVQTMAISVALRWMSGLYRGVVSGAEKLVFLSVLTALIATLRFVGVFCSMWVWGYTPRVFFIHQLAVALLELSGLLLMSRLLLPKKSLLDSAIGWSFEPLRPLLKFSLTIAFTSSVWVMVTQLDKLVLSGILPLADYGYFTLAVLVASGIMVISGPVSSAIMPRMARLHSEGNHDEMICVYRKATRLVVVIAGSAAVTIATCSEELLYAWTGNNTLAMKSAEILRLYALGNGVLIIAAFPYYLQYAIGNLKYHLRINLIFCLILMPFIIFAAKYYGGIGAGIIWLSLNLIYLFAGVWFIHHKLEPKMHSIWIMRDITPLIIPILLVAILAKLALSSTNSQKEAAIDLVFITLPVLITAFCGLMVNNRLSKI